LIDGKGVKDMIIKPYCRKTNYYETDQMGIIHHSNYIRWFEEARIDLLEQINFGYKRINECGIDFALLDVYCEYKSMVRFGDIINIHISLSELKEMRMAVDYKIINAESDEICTLGKTRHFFYDNNKKRPVSLKKEIPELYEIFCSLNLSNDK
jgi:acyl-CoA thioester hydrolase